MLGMPFADGWTLRGPGIAQTIRPVIEKDRIASRHRLCLVASECGGHHAAIERWESDEIVSAISGADRL
jgi:hypothetical protein